jgi:hypothetical protein
MTGDGTFAKKSKVESTSAGDGSAAPSGGTEGGCARAAPERFRERDDLEGMASEGDQNASDAGR